MAGCLVFLQGREGVADGFLPPRDNDGVWQGLVRSVPREHGLVRARLISFATVPCENG